MQMMFVDESGTPPRKGAANPKYFVLGGLIIPETIWHQVRDDLNQIKGKYGVQGELKWRYFVPANMDPANPMSGLSKDQRDALRLEVFHMLSRYRSVRIIAVVVDGSRAYSEKKYVNSQDDLYWYAYKQLVERFQYYLQDIHKDTGLPANGIVVCDHRGSQDDSMLRSLHAHLVEDDVHNTSQLRNLIENVFLSPSHMGIGIQLADLVAGAVFRNFERDDARWFDLIRGSFRRSHKGAIDGHGLVMWPKPRVKA